MNDLLRPGKKSASGGTRGGFTHEVVIFISHICRVVKRCIMPSDTHGGRDTEHGFDSPPVPFSVGCLRLAGPLITVGMAALWIVTDIFVTDRENAAQFLSGNVEVLVTVMTVTLGVTLLGLQFRAQSYTMIALIKLLKNRTVYGFIALFLVLITASLFVVVIDYDGLLDMAAYMVRVGTVLSMIYLVVYVYHMVHQMQPDMVIKSAISDMERSIAGGRDANSPMSESAKRHLDIWEQIMLGAIEKNNNDVFTRGMNGFFGVYTDHFKLYQKRLADPNLRLGSVDMYGVERNVTDDHNMFIRRLKPVMLSCVDNGRERFVRRFEECLKRVDDEGLHRVTDRAHYDDKDGILNLLREVVNYILVHDKPGMLDIMKTAINRRIETYCKWFASSNAPDPWRYHESAAVLKYVHVMLGKLIDSAIDRRSDDFLAWYLDVIDRYYVYALEDTECHYYPLEKCIAIAGYAVREGEVYVFARSMEVLFKLMSNPRGAPVRPMLNILVDPNRFEYDRKSAESKAVEKMRGYLSVYVMDVVKEAVKNDAYVRVFFRCYRSLDKAAYRPRRIWNYLMIWAADLSNADMFEEGMMSYDGGSGDQDNVTPFRGILDGIRVGRALPSGEMGELRRFLAGHRDTVRPHHKPDLLDDPPLAFIGNIFEADTFG